MLNEDTARCQANLELGMSDQNADKATEMAIRQRFLILGAPVLLVAVVFVQMYLAHTHYLTPWKGGGFGMFSTVDSQGARFVRVYLVTNDGKYPIEIPSDLQPLTRQIRTMPTSEGMYQLASMLAQKKWVPSSYLPFKPEPIYGQASNMGANNSLSNQAPTLDQGDFDNQTAVQLAGGDRPAVRPLKVGEPPPINGVIKLQEVQVELWRFSFDSRNLFLRAENFAEVIVKRSPK